MKEQLHFSTILTILPLWGKLKDTTKGDALKLQNQEVPAQKGMTLNLFPPIKVEANFPMTREYHKLLNTKCGMGK